jgi:hypothetical protein
MAHAVSHTPDTDEAGAWLADLRRRAQEGDYAFRLERSMFLVRRPACPSRRDRGV